MAICLVHFADITFGILVNIAYIYIFNYALDPPAPLSPSLHWRRARVSSFFVSSRVFVWWAPLCTAASCVTFVSARDREQHHARVQHATIAPHTEPEPSTCGREIEEIYRERENDR